MPTLDPILTMVLPFISAAFERLKTWLRIPPAGQPWAMMVLAGGVCALFILTGIGGLTWESFWVQSVALVFAVVGGYTLAKPVEAIPPRAAIPALLILGAGFGGLLELQRAALADSLATSSAGNEVKRALGETAIFWIQVGTSLLGGLIARIVKRIGGR
jgi:hypothetical protein